MRFSDWWTNRKLSNPEAEQLLPMGAITCQIGRLKRAAGGFVAMINSWRCGANGAD